MAKTAIHITDKDMAIYRATSRRQKEQERLVLLQKTQRAQQVARQAAKLLKERFGVRRVILFGSAAQGNLFHLRSDIDLAVEELKSQDFWRAWRELDKLGNEFEIDLVAIETVSPRLLLQIEREGVEL